MMNAFFALLPIGMILFNSFLGFHIPWWVIALSSVPALIIYLPTVLLALIWLKERF